MVGNIIKQIKLVNIVSLKFRITQNRSAPYLQFSQFGFYDANNNKYQWPSGVTWSADVSTPYQNDPINANTKLVLMASSCTVTINLPSGYNIDANVYCKYGWYTADDVPERDPVSWELFISEDGSNYIAVDARVNQTITETRNTLAFRGLYALPRS